MLTNLFFLLLFIFYYRGLSQELTKGREAGFSSPTRLVGFSSEMKDRFFLGS